MRLTLILLAFAWLAILDITLALYDPLALATKHHHHEHGSDSKGKAYSASKKGKKYGSKKGHKKKGKSHHNYDYDESSNNDDDFGLYKSDDHDSGGKSSKYFSGDFFHGFGHEHGGSSRNGKHRRGGKKKNKKFAKGFREKYSKDEQQKSSSFYSKGNKGGDYNIFGEENNKHGNEKGDKYSGLNRHSGHEEDNWGRRKTKDQGHNVAENKGYSNKDGKKRHYSRGKKYGRKGGKSKSGKTKGKGSYKYIPY